MDDLAAGDIAVPFTASSSYPVRGGNTVRPMIDGVPAFRRICAAIDAAHTSVWATITFMWPEFTMPDGRGAALDVLDRAAACGIDVRLIFWRPDEETAHHRRNAFWGSAEHLAQLQARRSGVNIRWDRAAPGFCQHQKSWLIDAGGDDATAFVGGINLNPHSLVAPGHAGGGGNHDVYLELAGPSVVDVHHNFVQRWNGASERGAVDGVWGTGGAVDLPFPTRVPARRGGVVAQIQRTMPAGRLVDGRATPGGKAFDIAAGERANLDQYRAAISAARSSIYIENQYLESPEIVADLLDALRRGVAVVALLPAVPDIPASVASAPERPAFLDARAALGAHPHFTLAGIAAPDADGRRAPVYVHAKLMVVDDAWATVGSCNLHRFSLGSNAEMNVAFRDPAAARALRVELLREHLDVDTSAMDGRAALRLFGEVARANRARLDRGDHVWQGLAFSLDPATYGR